jgi:hypothetical protein
MLENNFYLTSQLLSLYRVPSVRMNPEYAIKNSTISSFIKGHTEYNRITLSYPCDKVFIEEILPVSEFYLNTSYRTTERQAIFSITIIFHKMFCIGQETIG